MARPEAIVDYSSDDDSGDGDPAPAARDHAPPSDRALAFATMGFTAEQACAAMRVHGDDAPDDVIIDYILAMQHDVAPPAVASTSSAISVTGDSEELDDSTGNDLLRSMGFSTQDIVEAMSSCGSGAAIQTIIAYIIEHGSGAQPDEDMTALDTLTTLGYSYEQASQAIASCGAEDIDVLVDFLAARDFDAFEDDLEVAVPRRRKRARVEHHSRPLNGFGSPDETLERHSRRLKGFGLPAETPIPRNLTSTQARKPYFYFENVRTMPNGSWDIISNSLYGIQPEFVCASHFSVSRRARGYIHNLPLENRQLILPIPPKTIREFLPATVQYTPAWDTRQQLNCINTCGNTASFCRNVQRLMAAGEPSEEAKKTIMSLVRRWNLVWTGPGTCSPLEAHEIEQALGYERGHTRGAITINERFKSLGNTFQVDVVGFHLSALRPLFPDGIRMLSLFSGIGGAEVALHRAGIKLKFVVCVESNVDNRRILERWWSTSGQTGQHRILDDVQDLTMAVVARLMEESGGFDLVIGGSPCNNLTGNNRSSRTGLGGEHSVLFFEFSRILNLVRSLTR